MMMRSMRILVSLPGLLLGSVFVCLGLTATFVFGAQALASVQSYLWPKQECEVLESRIEQRGSSFAPLIRYRFVAHGEPQAGSRYTTSDFVHDNVGTVQRIVDQYRVGSKVPCFVESPPAINAVLVRGSLGPIPAVLLALLFVVVGIGTMCAVFKAPPGMASVNRPPVFSRSANTFQNNPWREAIGAIAFFGAFFVAGIALSALMINDHLRAEATSTWTENTCRVVSSGIQRHDSSHDDGGTTYSPNVLYEYTVGGRTLRSNMYRAFSFSFGDYWEAKEIADEYHPGMTTPCFVDPNDPTYAVLERGAGAWSLLIIMPLLFMLFGLAGLVWLVRGALRT